jgi:hypothetical protein
MPLPLLGIGHHWATGNKSIAVTQMARVSWRSPRSNRFIGLDRANRAKGCLRFSATRGGA